MSRSGTLDSSKSVTETFNTYRVLDDAIRNKKDIEPAKTLLTKENRTKLSYSNFFTLIVEVKDFEVRLRNEFFDILFELAACDIETYLPQLLLDGDGDAEWLALLILDRCPQMLTLKSKDQLPMHQAVKGGKTAVVDMILAWARENDRWGLVNPSTNGKGEPIEVEDNNTSPTSILEKAAKFGHIDMVKLLVSRDKRLLDYGYPLHNAVHGGHKHIVEYLLAEKVDLVEKIRPPPASRSALFEERLKGKEHESSKEIDKLLVDKIIRGGTKSPALVKKLLKGPQDQHTEICLDLSIFSQTTHRFGPFVDGLVRERQLFEVRFHPTLLYVEFPYLNASYFSDGPKTIGQEAAKILQWLRKKKNVTEIVRLRVPGSIPRAESEEFVEKALSGISVHVLDWRVLDLSIDILLNCDAKCVEVLSLYSSGNWGVLQQWSGAEGVALLPKLKHLEITIVKGLVSEDRANTCLEQLRDRLTHETRGTLKGRQITTHLHSGLWKSSESSLGSRMGLGTLQETTVTITKLKAFLDFYLGCNKEKSPSTTVAVIDNGVDGTLSTLSERIIDGQSLVEDFDGHESPWWLASHPHGTQMASFIHQLDPCCGLYIVKVCDGSGGIDADILAEAIRKAVEKRVDIISMSHTLPNTTDNLKDAVKLAKDNNIVMFSSRGDRGANREKVYPADHDGVIFILFFTNFGRPTESTETNAHYFFQGENVSIPAEPSYLESQKHASGSSVATALAAGVASLVLSCRRLVNKKQNMDRIQMVTNVFQAMTAGDKDRYVKPWEVFNDKRMGAEEGLLWLDRKFGIHGLYHDGPPSR